MVLGGAKYWSWGLGVKRPSLRTRDLSKLEMQSLGPHEGGLTGASRVYERSNRLVGINCKRIPYSRLYLTRPSIYPPLEPKYP